MASVRVIVLFLLSAPRPDNQDCTLAALSETAKLTTWLLFWSWADWAALAPVTTRL